MSLSVEEKIRYERQIIIDELGESGQESLRNSSVAVVGLGGLGSSAALYLAAAGIGTIALIDCDVVELSNLNRQILHCEEDIGISKVESAIGKIRSLDSGIKLTGINKRLTDENAMELLKDSDVIVDALDNFNTRFVLNRAAVKLRKPFIHGACRGFEGRVTTIIPGVTPCFECIFPSSPPDEKVPVLGATPGITGAMEAMEVIKYITGTEGLLAARLLIFDGKNWSFEMMNIKRNPKCTVCGSL